MRAQNTTCTRYSHRSHLVQSICFSYLLCWWSHLGGSVSTGSRSCTQALILGRSLGLSKLVWTHSLQYWQEARGSNGSERRSSAERDLTWQSWWMTVLRISGTLSKRSYIQMDPSCKGYTTTIFCRIHSTWILTLMFHAASCTETSTPYPRAKRSITRSFPLIW